MDATEDTEHARRRISARALCASVEAAEQVAAGCDEDAGRTQQTRLGIRLAQSLVGGVPAPEVDRRLDRWRLQYRARFPT